MAKVISIEELERIGRRRNAVISEGREVELGDGRRATAVRVRADGFRPTDYLVALPEEAGANDSKAPDGWEVAETATPQ